MFSANKEDVGLDQKTNLNYIDIGELRGNAIVMYARVCMHVTKSLLVAHLSFFAIVRKVNYSFKFDQVQNYCDVTWPRPIYLPPCDVSDESHLFHYVTNLMDSYYRKVAMGFPTTPKLAPNSTPSLHFGGRKHENNREKLTFSTFKWKSLLWSFSVQQLATVKLFVFRWQLCNAY